MMPEHRTTRLGVAQPTFACDIRADETDAAKVAGSVMKNAAHTAELVDVAAGLGVELLCFPEDTGTICGYADRPENQPRARSIMRDTGEKVVDVFRAAAAKANIHVVACAFVTQDDYVFNRAYLIGPDGEDIGHYDKTHPTRGEQPFTQPGTEYPVFDTKFGRVGIVICADFNFPEPARILALNGAELILCPTLGMDYGGEHMGEMRMRVRAFDSAVYVAASMYASKRADGPGRSCIVGPSGHFLADAGYAPDTVAWADITPTKRAIDPMDPDGKTGSNMWTVWKNNRRPGTYGAMVREEDAESQ
jgi:predicted amidohydrolase